MSERRQAAARGRERQTLQAWAASALGDMLYLAGDTPQNAQSTLLALADLADAPSDFVDEALGNIAQRFRESQKCCGSMSLSGI